MPIILMPLATLGDGAITLMPLAAAAATISRLMLYGAAMPILCLLFSRF